MDSQIVFQQCEDILGQTQGEDTKELVSSLYVDPYTKEVTRISSASHVMRIVHVKPIIEMNEKRR